MGLISWTPIFAAFFLLAACDNSDNGAGRPSTGLFVDVTEKVGLDFVHDPAVAGSYFMPESMGSGAALLDYDNDGDLDLYFINGAHHSADDRGRPPLQNQLYRQERSGTFTNVTDSAGVGDLGYGMGAAVADIDNDGDVDIYVTNYGPDALYRNNGDGTFTNIAAQAGIDNPLWGCSVIFLDYDLDSFLDIYVTNYVRYDPAQRCSDRSGRQDYCGPAGFPGTPDVLYRNNGDGTFSDRSRPSGIATGLSKGLGAVSADFDGDKLPDIYVANDGEANHLWLNQGDGTFQDKGLLFGAALSDLGRPEAGMGIALGDADNDSDVDLFVTHLREESNTFYRFSKEVGFQDDSAQSGLGGASLPFTGFGVGFIDYDHDGDLDLAAANGRVARGSVLSGADGLGYWAAYAEPNALFENDGNGRFQTVTNASDFTSPMENSRGLAFGDVDNDGDIDLLLCNGGGKARLLWNEMPHKGNWLVVSAMLPAQNRLALGASITVFMEDRKLTRLATSGYSYLCSSDPRAHFGLGPATSVSEIQVTWPNGSEETFPGSPANRFVTVNKGAGR